MLVWYPLSGMHVQPGSLKRPHPHACMLVFTCGQVWMQVPIGCSPLSWILASVILQESVSHLTAEDRMCRSAQRPLWSSLSQRAVWAECGWSDWPPTCHFGRFFLLTAGHVSLGLLVCALSLQGASRADAPAPCRPEAWEKASLAALCPP